MDVNERLAQKARVSRDTIVRVKYILSSKQYAQEGLFDKLDAEEITIHAVYHQIWRRKKQHSKAKRTAVRMKYVNDLSKGIENNVICDDALEGIKQIPDGSVSLAFTSPPFGVNQPYADNVSDCKPWNEHIDYLSQVFGELKPKFRPGGRCVIEYQAIRTREKQDQSSEYNRPIHAVIVNMMQKLGYFYWTTIIWNKGHVGNQPKPWGSIGSPSTPIMRDTHSYLFVFSVGGWTLPCVSGDPSELSREDYDQLTQSVWNVHTEIKPIGSHVCPMPVELAERVIRLYSYKGDLIVDPFGGSGTTAIAALRSQRRFVLIDKSPTYCADSKQRIDAEMLKLNPNPPINQVA
jgi:DNA modification methylase